MPISTYQNKENAAHSNGYVMAIPIGTLAVGDVVVVASQSENNPVADRPGTPTITGGGLTLTARQVSDSVGGSTGYCTTRLYAGTVSAAGAKTLNFLDPTDTNSVQYNAVVRVYPAADGYSLAATPANVGNTAATTCLSGTTGVPTGTLTTTQAGSEIFACCGDWTAQNPSTVGYASGFAEIGTNLTTGTVVPSYVSGRSTQYWMAKTCGAAGAQTVGLTAPTGQKWTLAGVEIQRTLAAIPDFAAFM